MSLLFWPSHFILSGAISNCPLLFTSSVLDIYRPKSGLSSGVISFCLFILFMRFLQQEYWSSLPFPPLSELFTMTRLSWVTLMAWLISLLSYASPFALTRMLSMKLYICVFVYIYKNHIYKTAYVYN